MIFRTDLLDTTPGATGELAVLAPPAEITTEDAYLQWLRMARRDLQLFNVMVFLARAYLRSTVLRKPTIVGPMASTLDQALRGMAKWLTQSPKERHPDGPPSLPMSLAPPAGEPPLDLFQMQEL